MMRLAAIAFLVAVWGGCATTGPGEGGAIPTSFEEALEILNSSEVADRIEAVQYIGAERDPRGLVPLQEALGDEDLLVRLEATLALRNYDSPVTIPLLRPILEDEDADMRYSAAVALFELDDYSGVDVLVEGLRSQRSNYRLTSALFLSRIRWRPAVPGLLEMLTDEDPRNRSQAAYSLGWIFCAPEAVDPLLAAMKDPVPFVRKDAWEALKQITGETLPFSYEAGPELREAQLVVWRRWRLAHREETAPPTPSPVPAEESGE